MDFRRTTVLLTASKVFLGFLVGSGRVQEAFACPSGHLLNPSKRTAGAVLLDVTRLPSGVVLS